jgi:hypothetical protein
MTMKTTNGTASGWPTHCANMPEIMAPRPRPPRTRGGSRDAAAMWWLWMSLVVKCPGCAIGFNAEVCIWLSLDAIN